MRTAPLLAFLAACTATPLPATAERPSDTSRGSDAVRVVSWNIESVGKRGTQQYDAALQTLARLDADVVALQEVNWWQDRYDLTDLAEDAGYPHVVEGWPVSFGSDTQAILSRMNVLHSEVVNATDVSEDADARDITRSFVSATVNAAVPLTVVSAHLKSGGYDDAEFRRSVDAIRGAESLGSFDTHQDAIIFCGDINEELEDVPADPPFFDEVPYGTPKSYSLGDDMEHRMEEAGIPNNPFEPFQELGMVVLDAEQMGGGEATRPVSWRRLDYFFTTQVLANTAETEVYDTRDDAMGLGLPKAATVPTLSSLTAADHLPIVADFALGSVSPLLALSRGDLQITEVHANPSDCPDARGEWFEIRNLTGTGLDLAGLMVEDNHGAESLAPLWLDPGERAVLGRSGDCVAIDGLTTLSLSNSSDELRLISPSGIELHSVSWERTHDGDSLIFDGANWCDQAPSPGGAPQPCAATDHRPPQPGDLVISEVMADPTNCGDASGEWFEMHNVSDAWLELADLRVADTQGDAELFGATRIGPGEYMAFARSDACIDNVGRFSLSLANGGDSLSLLMQDQTIDRFVYESSTPGMSWSREGEHWCETPDGTPGAPHPGCNE